MAKFTSCEDEQLIELVSGHPILWNMADKEFKNTMKKDLVWKEIGLLINKTANECKTRWRSIKDYRLRKKKIDAKVGTGSAAIKRKAGYWNRLNFLDTVEEERCTMTNIETDDTQISVANDNTDIENKTSDDDEFDPAYPIDETVKNVNSSGQKILKKKIRKDKDLMELLRSRDKEREENRKRIHQVLSQDEDDEINLFFKAMAATVKKFSYENQVETKMQVFNIVSQMEIRQNSSRHVDGYTTFNCPEELCTPTMSSASFSSVSTTPGISPIQSPIPSNEHPLSQPFSQSSSF